MSINAKNHVLVASKASTSGVLNVSVITSSLNGSYAPRNIVAIWIQDNAGKFVKTMMILAESRKEYLNSWWLNTTPAGNSVDATTGETQLSHGKRTCTWNATNASNVIVADGTYTVKVEMTESNFGSIVGTFYFEKGPNTVNIMPADVPNFSNINITWIPAATGIEDVKPAKLYNVYPNPATSSIFVNGLDIYEVEILSLSGKSILKTKEQTINVSSLMRGNYLLNIKSKMGTVLKK